MKVLITGKQILFTKLYLFFISGEKMSNSEVEILTAGREDSNGMVNYEGNNLDDLSL